MAAGNPSFGLTTHDLKSFGANPSGGPTILHADGAGSSITVPGGTMLLTADFSQAGNDLVIVGQDGTRVVVQDYFAIDPPPALQTAGGATLTADIVEHLSGAGAGLQFAQAAGGAVAAAQPIGTVDTAQGTVVAIRANGERVTLQVGDPVFQGDTIQTSGGGSLAVTFVDQSTFTVGDNARMVLDELVYDPATKTGTSAFSVVQGVFSFVSGAIAKTGSDAMTVRTPVATIGIRGTQVAVQANAEGENNAITLLQEEGGITGEIVVTNSAGSQVLNQAFQTTNINSFFEPPTRPVVLPEAQVRTMYGNAIDQLHTVINQHAAAANPTTGRDATTTPAANAPAENRPADATAPAAAPPEASPAAPAPTQQAAAAPPPADDITAGTVVAAAPAPTPANPVAEAAAQIATALAAATGEDPAAVAARLAAAGGALDALINTAAGGNGFGGIDGLPPANLGVGSNSYAAQAGLDTQAAQIQGITNTNNNLPGTDTNAPVFGPQTTTVTAPVIPTDTTASAPTVTVAAAAGNEDNAIALNIGAALTDNDGSESITSIVIAGVPNGALLSAGTNNGNGTWTLTPAQLAGLTITPAPNSDADFTLSVSATSTESAGGASATTTALMTVTVGAVADAPTVVFNSVTLSGNEDGTIPLNLGVQLKDTDGSESITNITIAGMPAGATLSAGTNNGDGTWTLTPAQLTGLTLTPVPGSDADLALVVRMTSTEAAGGSASTLAGFTVSVNQVADAPTVTVTNVTGLEDSAIPLNIGVALNDVDGSESITNVTVSGVPQGAILSAGTNNGNGTWTLTPAQLTGLSILPPAGSDTDFSLSVSATSTEAAGGAATTLATFAVTVNAAADAPTVTVADVAGTEDHAIPLNIGVALNDTDGSESITNITISGVPNGATLSAGTNNGNGTWTLTPAQLTNLSITPAPGSDADFTLSVSATSAEANDGTATTVRSFTVAVAQSADAPTVTVSDVTGAEDTAIPLNLGVALNDLDGSESISNITISGVPAGASLSAGSNNGNGSWTLTPAQLNGLTITPAAGSDADFQLSVSATSTEAAGGTATTLGTFAVNVTAGADAPTVTLSSATGAEDSAIPLNIGVALNDLDGSESITNITVAGVPAGASLSAGSNNGDGTWTLTPAQLSGLFLTPPAGASTDFALTVSATSTEAAGGSATTVGTLQVTVAAAADAPTVTVSSAAGAEDSAIPLDIGVALTDVDGSESITNITVSGVPTGAVLSAGTNNLDGTWTLTPGQLSGLKITPPANSDADFTLSVSATSTDVDGSKATSVASLAVNVTGVADAPKVTVADATGAEDTEIPLNIDVALSDVDGSESITSVTISGVPEGATLSAGSNNGNGTWTLPVDAIDGLKLTPAAGSDADFTLTVTAQSSEAGGGSATTVATLNVGVAAVADTPVVTVHDAAGAEDKPIALDLAARLQDLDGSETLSVTIAGVPDGAKLSAGSNNGDGTWTLTPAQLQGLSITPAADAYGDFALTMTATSTEAAGGSASTLGTFNVSVANVADTPTVSVAAATGAEESAIPLNIAPALAAVDAGQGTLSVTIAGVPAGAVLSAGSNNGNGSWTLTPAQLQGLTITPAANSTADFSLTVTASATGAAGGTATSEPVTLAVDVKGVADTPTVTVSNATGNEDSAIPLNIAPALADVDAGQGTLSVTIAGVPNGAVLSAGTNNGNGTWTLTPAQLQGLTVTPAANSTADFSLTVTANAQGEAGGVATSAPVTLTVDVQGVADTPTVAVSAAVGAEDSAIALNIAPALADVDAGAGTLSVTIAGVPNGAMLSAGTNNGNGTWTLTPAQLQGLTITPALNSTADFSLTVTASAQGEAGGVATSAPVTLAVDVTGVADTPAVSVAPAVGAEDSAIALNIAPALSGVDAGAGTLSVIIAGVPDGATLSAGTNNGNGSWTLTPAQLQGLTITPALNSTADFSLTVTAQAQGESGAAAASAPVTLTVDVQGVADTPTVSVAPADGAEDSAIALDIAPALAGVDAGQGTLSVTIAGVPNGALLSAGTNNGDGSWTLTPAQLQGLTITPPLNSSADFSLTVTAQAQGEAGGVATSAPATLTVGVSGVADEAVVTVGNVTGVEDQAGGIPLNLATNFPDTDGSEVQTVTISGLPAGMQLSAGTNNGNGTWTIAQADVGGLKLLPGANVDGNYTFTVTATSTEDGTTSSVSKPFAVAITGVADQAVVTAGNVTGTEDQAGGIPLNLAVNFPDTDGSEVQRVTIAGLPNGMQLSAGTDNGNGTWTVPQADLGTLKLLPGANVAGDFTFTVTALSSEDGSIAVASKSFGVSIDGVADTATVTVSDVSGVEDQAGGIPLNLAVNFPDTDGSEVQSITISGLPQGMQLSAGTDNGNGTWTIPQADIGSVKLLPGANVNGDFNFTVTATSSEDGTTQTVSKSFGVSIGGVADAPTVTVTNAIGAEDSPIALNIAPALAAVDAGEGTLSVTIAGVPNGALLSAGTNNGNGTWTLTPAQLNGLTITPALNSTTDFSLTVTAQAQGEAAGAATSQPVTLNVDVRGVADTPTVSVAPAGGDEDSAIALNIAPALAAVDAGAGTLSVTISGVPNGALLSAGTNNNDGSWTLTPAQLDGLTITPPVNSSADMTLTVTAQAQGEAGAAATSAPVTFQVAVQGVADAATVTVHDLTGTEDKALPLNIAAAFPDTDGSEAQVITIAGVPAGATLSAGTNNNGTWTLTPAQLNGLTLTPAANSSADFTLTVTATSTEDGTTASTTKSFGVAIGGVADAATLTVQDLTGTEDTPLPLNIAAAFPDTDGSEAQTITIAGVPNGALLSAGTNNGNGTWTLTPAQLNGLAITPAANSAADFTLTVTATSTEDGTTASTTKSFGVAIGGVADAATVTVQDLTGTEDTPLPLNIAAAFPDTDGSEAQVITIAGVPNGATLSAGTNNGNGTWTLTPAQLNGLAITPATNSAADFTLTVTATSTEDGTTASTTKSFGVAIGGVADAATLTVQNLTGTEDTPLPLNIAAAFPDADGSEAQTITVAGVPNGATLSAGTNNNNGTWTLTPAQLNGLAITPAANSAADFTLTVTATSTEDGTTASTTKSFGVAIGGVADAATVTVHDLTGTEDTPLPLNIAAAFPDTDGSETQTIAIAGVPNGALLSAGTNNGNGTWTLTPAQLNGLAITPAANSSADFTLTVTATSTEDGTTATTTQSFAVSVGGVADAPTLAVQNVTGLEDKAIALNISAGLTDTDGSESLSITVAGVPSGALLSAGTNNNDGTWTLTPAQLNGLTITPAPNSDADFTLSLTATSSEDGTTASTTQSFAVNVTGVADVPTVSVGAASGNEDTGIPLNITSALTDTDGSETLSITVAGLPTGATLSAGTNNGNGTWTLTPQQLQGLTLTPPDDSNVDFDLTVTARSTDGTSSAQSTASLHVDLKGVADTPSLTASIGVGSVVDVQEAPAIDSITLSVAKSGNGNSGQFQVFVDGQPVGTFTTTVAHGSQGNWQNITIGGLSLEPGSNPVITLQPVGNNCGVLVNSITVNGAALQAETSGMVGAIGTALTGLVASNDTHDYVKLTGGNQLSFPLGEAQLGEAPTAVAGTTFPFNIQTGLNDTDGSETLAINVSGLPSGVTLSAGTNNADGTWTLAPNQLSGLTMFVPSAVTEAFSPVVASTATENDGDTATATLALNMDGQDVTASTPTLAVGTAAGNEDTAIALPINAALVDVDGSETLSITVAGVPAGATLSAGTNNGNGTWTLTPAQLNGLTVTPAANASADFALTVTATATEANGGDTATSVATLNVTVNAVADYPTVSVANVSGNEDTGIALNIGAALNDVDGSENLSITVSGLPAGATLSAGTNNDDGTWSVTPAQLNGLTVTPPTNSDADFALTVTAQAVDHDPDTHGQPSKATTVATFNVAVNSVADAPTVTVSNVSGNEDSAIPLNIASALTDTDGSETLSVTISGVPNGATLSAGTNNGNGTWTLTPAQLTNLAITPPVNSDADFNLTVKATSTEAAGGSNTTTATFNVAVNAVADAPTVTVSNVSGNEDSAIPLNIASALTDTDGSETLSITVSGVPNGATLSAGTNNGGGTWTLTPAQLANLSITPPANSDADFNLTVKATSTEGAGGSATTTATFNVAVNAVADAPTVTVSNVSGNEDTGIPLNIASALTDTDGSETLSVTVSGMPAGATLSAGTNNGDGSWTLTPAQLNGLVLTPPANSDADFSLTVKATSTEGAGGSATTTATFNVAVNAVADAPTVTVTPAAGAEDTPIPLNIMTALADTDGSESITAVTITGLPAGATLSAGTHNADGSWTLTPAQLGGLTLTPATNSDADFTLKVSATSTEVAGGSATTTATLDVTVSGVADAATVTVQTVNGAEDTALPLNIAAQFPDMDGSEVHTITISGVPAGATLSAGTNNGNGNWTLTPAQLNNVALTPAANSSADFTLTVTATSTEDGTTVSTAKSFAVNVSGVADQATLTVQNVTGNEDTALPLNITAAFPDADGSEVQTVTISGLPAGATLSAGTNNNGTWTLTPAQLQGLTITPAANSSADFTLNVTAISTEDGTTASVSKSLAVTVNGVADAATLTVQNVSGAEDTALPLNITAAFPDADGSETQTITIAGLPAGATLSAGTNNNGTWTLTPAQLNGLTLTPAANSSADFTLTVTATSTEDGTTASTVKTLAVNVSGVADAATVTVQTVNGTEDTPMPLNIAASFPDTDGSETQTITIAGLPAGATLSAGTNNNGTWTLTPAQLNGLTLTPAANSAADFTLTVTATSTEDNTSASTVKTFAVNVGGVADAATLTVQNVSGAEDTALPLNISAAFPDTDGSETQTITIAGLPAGATLSAGTNNNGTWTLTPAQLNGLTLTPAANSSADFTLTVTATSTEDGTTASTVKTLAVNVSGVADAATVTVQNVTGNEDTQLPLNIAASFPDTDGSETQTITIAGLPAGATLSAGTNNNGTWTLTPAQLNGLTLTPAANSAADFTLTVTATSTEDGTTASTVKSFAVNVGGVADAATLTVQNVTGNEDTALPLNITAAFPDTDGSEVQTITIAGLPNGATLSAGTNNGGTWTLTPAQLNGLTLTPAANSDADFTLTVTATSTEDGTTATAVKTLAVTVNAVADQATLTVQNVTGNEDTALPLNITAAFPDTDGSEVQTITIAGLPSGATLSAGTNNNGTWTLTPAQLNGLTLTPAANSDADFNLTVTATSSEGGTTATAVKTLAVTVNAVADQATLTVQNVTGNEDTQLPLNITAAFPDMDGSETQTITIAGLPSGATLSAGSNSGGTWTLTPAQLNGLKLIPAANSDADFTLTVTATSTEGGTTASVAKTLAVTVNAVADQATLTVQNVTGNEDTALPLNITAAFPDTDGSETQTITIAGLPQGATLSAGTNNGGTWTLTPAQLQGLTLTGASNSDADFTLTVTATSTEGGTTATIAKTLAVTVNGVADAASVTVQNVTGNEDTVLPLNITAAFPDTDGSETQTITIAGLPSGATLSAGTNNGGTWTLTPAQLNGLTLTPAANSDADFTLTVTATSTEGGTTASTVKTLAVTVNAVADQATLTVQNVSGAEDTQLPLNITAAFPDTDGSETQTITITGLPSGATLSAGSNSNGTWTLTPAQLSGLKVIPAANSDADFTLTVTATSTEGGTTASTTKTLAVNVSGVADAATVTVQNVTGNEDTQLPLNITASFPDTDGSETQTVTITGLPTGASLSAGTNNNGTWTLTPAQLSGLKLIPAANSDADFTLTVTATASEDGTTVSTTKTLAVTVNAVADAANLTVQNVSGNEDTQLPLNITAAFPDADGSEIQTITIAGLPTGATLSAGTNVGGVWTLTPAQLSGLKVIPVANSDADFTLTVTATSTEGGTTATSTATFNVVYNAVADAPTLTVQNVTGNEDTPIPLNITTAVADMDGSETITSVTISGLPTGATLSAGTNNNGTWTLTPLQLVGLSLIPAANSDADFNLTVKATSTEGAGGSATTTGTLSVTVNAVADVPTVTVAPASGNEDTAIALNIGATLADVDGSETITAVTISGVPTGATLSAGTNNGNGTWTLTPAQLTGLTITPTANSDADFTLTVKATSTEGVGGSTATSSGISLSVTVNPVADAPIIDLNTSVAGNQTSNTLSGTAGGAIALNLSAALSDTDGSETLSVTITGVPTGATLSAGTNAGGGTWVLTPAQLTGLSLNAPGSASSFNLTVTATSTEAGGGTAVTSGTIGVTVTGVTPATSGNDNITGTSGNDTIDGLAGDDTIQAGAGNDTITGGLGTDKLYGQDGDDTFVYTADGTANGYNYSNDTYDGGAGNDTVQLTSGNDVLQLDDRYWYGGTAAAPKLVSIEKIDAGAGDDWVDLLSSTYTYGNIQIVGGAGNDYIFSGAGNDTLDGGTGDDLLYGGAGNDTLIGGAGYNTLAGGDGTDTADYSTATRGVSVDLSGHSGAQFAQALAGSGSYFEDDLSSIENVVGTG